MKKNIKFIIIGIIIGGLLFTGVGEQCNFEYTGLIQ